MRVEICYNREDYFHYLTRKRIDMTTLIDGKALATKLQRALAAKTAHKAGERILGTDPVSGKQVSVKIGRFGPVAQIGTAEDEEKPRFAQVKKEMSIETITLEEALELFKLPRTLGKYEGKNVVVGAGRFGPYIQNNGLYASLP